MQCATYDSKCGSVSIVAFVSKIADWQSKARPNKYF